MMINSSNRNNKETPTEDGPNTPKKRNGLAEPLFPSVRSANNNYESFISRDNRPSEVDDGSRMLFRTFSLLQPVRTPSSVHTVSNRATALDAVLLWPLFAKVALFIVLIPATGFIMIITALSMRAAKRFFISRDDWKVLLIVGVLFQIAVVCPINNFFSETKVILVDHLQLYGDYYAPTGFYVLISAYFLAMIVCYFHFDSQKSKPTSVAPSRASAQSASSRRFVVDPDAPPGGKGPDAAHLFTHRAFAEEVAANHISQTLEQAMAIKTSLQHNVIFGDGYSLGSFWVLLFFSGVCLPVFQTLVLRICQLSADATSCTHFFVFMMPKYQVLPLELVTLFWYIIYLTVNTSIMMAMLLYYQQLKVMEQFTYFSNDEGAKLGEAAPSSWAVDDDFAMSRSTMNHFPQSAPSGSTQHIRKLADLMGDDNVTVWAEVWHSLVMDMKEKPVSRAMMYPSLVGMVMFTVVSVSYVAIDNLFAQRRMAELTAGLLSQSAIFFCVLLSFVARTVQMTRAMDFHTKRIALAQNDLQNKIEGEKNEISPGELKLLRSKVRVLQSLDLYLRFSDSRPKLGGLSLESLRWVMIVLGLVFLNAFFFGLYYTHCYDK